MRMNRSIRKTIFTNIFVTSILLLSACSSTLPVKVQLYELTNSWGQKGVGLGEFNEPTGIALTGTEIFISDARNARIQVFDYAGKYRREFGNKGSEEEKLGRPMNLAIHADELYVADYFKDQIKVYSLSGDYKRNIGKSGNGNGEFNAPVGVDVAKNGDLYIADFYNQRIQQLDADGNFIRQWGKTEKTGIWSGMFNYPTAVAVAENNVFYVADGFNDRVQVFDAAGKYSHKWGGLWGMNISGKKPGWFTTVTAIKIGLDNNVYVADFYNDRVQVFTSSGELLNIIDVPINGIQHSAIAMAVTDNGSLFIVNYGKHEIQHWKKF